MSDFRSINLHSIREPRGQLTVLQDALPFDVRRVFWITDADGEIRGGHRHDVTRQAMIAVAGSVDVYLNDGRHEATVRLDLPSRCLLVEPEDWHTMHFRAGAVLLVIASTTYDPADYITEPHRAKLQT